MLTFALPTGRSLDSCIVLLENAGLPVEALKNAGRNLVIEDGNFRYLLAKPADVPVAAYNGAADLAFAGSDVIAESEIPVVELLDTGMNSCILAIAGPEKEAVKFSGSTAKLTGLRVATKYMKTAEKIFNSWGVQLKLLKLNGSIELAPALGLSDVIFDIVQTGSTLKANGLVVIKEIMPVSMRLVSAAGTIHTRWNELKDIVAALRIAAEKQEA